MGCSVMSMAFECADAPVLAKIFHGHQRFDLYRESEKRRRRVRIKLEYLPPHRIISVLWSTMCEISRQSEKMGRGRQIESEREEGREGVKYKNFTPT